MKILMFSLVALSTVMVFGATNEVADLGIVVVEGNALSKYRPEKVTGATFTDLAPEKSPTVVDTLTEDFIREHNPTDLHDLMRYVPGIETGGKSLLVRQPGTFTIRGQGGTEPMIDGMLPIGRGAGLFMDPFLLERVEIVKGPIGSLNGGSGAVQNASGAGGSVNLHVKGAYLDASEILFQENTSVGNDTWRQRGMIDANEVIVDDRFAMRLIGSFDLYSPTYANCGRADGADPRQSYSIAPSFILKASEDVTVGLKTLFQTADQPSYIGVPIWRGKPGAGYGWYESSCLASSRTKYDSFMINPYVDWQVNENWLLKFGGAMFWSEWEQHTPEPFYPSTVARGGTLPNQAAVNQYLSYYYAHGVWPGGERYMSSGFSNSESLSRCYNLYARSVYEEEYASGIVNCFVIQDDYYYRESSGGFGDPISRYGILLQDQVGYGWVTLLGGVRYDYFRKHEYNGNDALDAHAVSPRGGLTIQPLDWLVFFGNISQTRTPMLGVNDPKGRPLTDPWYSTQYEGGVRVRPCERLWLSVSTYRIESENRPTTVDRIHYVSEGEDVTKGVELSLSGEITENWSVLAMYSFSRYKNLNAAPGTKARDFERYPEHSVSLNTSYRFDCCDLLRDVVIGAGYRYRSKYYGTMTGAYVNENIYFDPSHVFDVNCSMPLSKFGGPKDWILTFGVRNLFGEEYIESARHWYECLAGEPRTFEIGLRGRF